MREPPAGRGLLADPKEHEDAEGQHQGGDEAAVDRLREFRSQSHPHPRPPGTVLGSGTADNYLHR
ncbi:MAG TPA: hypothetical protein VKD72_35470 [Gemmataceae bacterium]|nr:hypothetical protein [Gemmataceae bacterium]